ncbi:MAG TPA: cache domain-containing protein [Aestuariivirgaceae bacterium]|jgi:signal transduction histidine kinase
MNRRDIIGAGVFVVAACTLRRVESAELHTEEDAQAMVERAISMFKSEGAEAVIASVNAADPAFRDGELYIFMVGPNGRSVANAANIARVGLDVASIVDVDGNPYGRDILELASAHGTWVQYKIKNPASGKIEPKMSWVKRVDGYIFGCGIYRPN